MKKSHHKWTALALVLSLFFWTFSGALAASASDISGHWAEAQLNDWLDQGLLSGYEDGTVRPNQPVTRAEFVAMVNRAFGLSASGSAVDYPDVERGHWSYEPIASAVQEGYISGYEDGTFRPDREVSRQEVAVMVNNIVQLDGAATGQAANRFTDAAQIAAWSYDAVDAVTNADIMRGYEDGSFQPTKSITRAEAVVTIATSLTVYAEQWAAIYGEAGTYGPADGNETIEGNVLVKADGVTLQNVTITGDLLLGRGIGEGEATLDNVTVEGTTTVQGGGVNSIYVSNSELVTVIVDKNGDVRIVATNSEIGPLNVASGGQVILSGDYSHVQIDVPGVELVLEEGSVNELTVVEGAGNVGIHVADDAEVGTLTLNAAVQVTGSGTIDKAVIHADGSSFEQEPRSMELADGITAEVDGEQSTDSTPPFIGGGGGGGRSGGGQSNTISVEELTNVWMLVDSEEQLEVVTHPEDADFGVVSGDTSVVEAVYEVRDSSKIITLTGLAPGTSTVTVDVYKDGYNEIEVSFDVNVLEAFEADHYGDLYFDEYTFILDLEPYSRVGFTEVAVENVEGNLVGEAFRLVVEGEIMDDWGLYLSIPTTVNDAALYWYDEDLEQWKMLDSRILDHHDQLVLEAIIFEDGLFALLTDTVELNALKSINEVQNLDEMKDALEEFGEILGFDTDLYDHYSAGRVNANAVAQYVMDVKEGFGAHPSVITVKLAFQLAVVYQLEVSHFIEVIHAVQGLPVEEADYMFGFFDQSIEYSLAGVLVNDLLYDYVWLLGIYLDKTPEIQQQVSEQLVERASELGNPYDLDTIFEALFQLMFY